MTMRSERQWVKTDHSAASSIGQTPESRSEIVVRPHFHRNSLPNDKVPRVLWHAPEASLGPLRWRSILEVLPSGKPVPRLVPSRSRRMRHADFQHVPIYAQHPSTAVQGGVKAPGGTLTRLHRETSDRRTGKQVARAQNLPKRRNAPGAQG
jgi:hypothetical protein